MAHVFLSDVREDLEVVDQIAAELRRQGLEVWLDRDSIEPGTPWEAAIESAINAGVDHRKRRSIAVVREGYVTSQVTVFGGVSTT